LRSVSNGRWILYRFRGVRRFGEKAPERERDRLGLPQARASQEPSSKSPRQLVFWRPASATETVGSGGNGGGLETDIQRSPRVTRPLAPTLPILASCRRDIASRPIAVATLDGLHRGELGLQHADAVEFQGQGIVIALGTAPGRRTHLEHPRRRSTAKPKSAHCSPSATPTASCPSRIARCRS
jgi:hypothetical protein